MSKLKFNVLVQGTLRGFAALLRSMERLRFGALPPLCAPFGYVISCLRLLYGEDAFIYRCISKVVLEL